MKRRSFLKTVPAYAVLARAATGFAQNAGTSSSPVLEPIKLPPPETDGGTSVLAALGVNREEGVQTGRTGRTAATASNSQEIDLYVALPEGVFLYEAVPHRLNPVAAGDFRSRSGRQAIRLRGSLFL